MEKKVCVNTDLKLGIQVFTNLAQTEVKTFESSNTVNLERLILIYILDTLRSEDKSLIL